MCGRYALYRTSQIARLFRTRPPPFALNDSYNVAPGQHLPVIVQREHDRQVESMKWGLVPVWAKDPHVGYKMINARAEGIFRKPTWSGPIKRHRCLVPANGFYEWKRVAGERAKRPVYIYPGDQELFAFAGVFDVWHDPTGNELLSYAIVTTGPNLEMQAIHDRMPVILRPDDWDAWTDQTIQSPEIIESMLRPYDDGQLKMYEVSTDVNVVRNDDSHLVQPVGG